MNPDYIALANYAVGLIPDGARIGIGTGRTASAVIQHLAERHRQGLKVRCVPTSDASATLAAKLGLPIETLDADEPIEMTIDGADEVERSTLHVIKGLGGAMMRERIVAAASRRQILVVTANKLVDRLGERGILPVEILPFAVAFCMRKIAAIEPAGILKPILRGGDNPVVTDNGNWIVDCEVGPLNNPLALDQTLRSIPGVLDTGFFLGTASLVLVADGGQVTEMQPG